MASVANRRVCSPGKLGRSPFAPKFRDFRSETEWNGKVPGKVFENLGIRFECTLFDGISGIIENFVFHSQEMSGLVSSPSVSSRGHCNELKLYLVIDIYSSNPHLTLSDCLCLTVSYI